MDSPSPPRILADTGGLVVTDDGRRVDVVDRGTGELSILAFVLGVLGLVAGGFGAVALVAGAPSRVLGATLLLAGLAVAAMLALVVRQIKRRRVQPPGSCRSVAVLDRELGVLAVGGVIVLPLNQVSFARRLQLGSSSPKLVAITPTGTYDLKRGNPFDGGIGRVDEVLNDIVQGGTQPGYADHP